jgi:hypothetical protein
VEGEVDIAATFPRQAPQFPGSRRLRLRLPGHGPGAGSSHYTKVGKPLQPDSWAGPPVLNRVARQEFLVQTQAQAGASNTGLSATWS